MIALFKNMVNNALVVSGAIPVEQLRVAGFHTPSFSQPAGANGRQWLFIQYRIPSVNILWTGLGLTINGEGLGNDTVSLNTSDAGGSQVTYTACHAGNNLTSGVIFLNWLGVPGLSGSSLYYSILYRNID